MTGSTSLERTTQLLASPATRIELDDHVTVILRTTLDAVSTKTFSVSGTEGEQDFAARVAAYDAAVAELRDTVILLARWADRDGIILLEKIFARLAAARCGFLSRRRQAFQARSRSLQSATRPVSRVVMGRQQTAGGSIAPSGQPRP
jgi:hypothetical protein